MSHDNNQEIIEQYFVDTTISAQNIPLELSQALEQILHNLETGSLRVAEKTPNRWQVNIWLKKAILLYFKTQANQHIKAEFTNFYDKIPLRFNNYTADDFSQLGARIVPPACVRRGAYIGEKVVLMPSYTNIGAYVDEGTMIDTWATVGSCAQIGKHVHISGGVGIGGVLEPLQARPVIIEDNCFIGARSEIVEGIIVEKNSVISMGVFLGQSTKIYDRENDTIHYGVVPEGSVVVPGSLPAQNGKYNLNCAVIVKKVDAQTRSKVAINEILRS